MMRAPDKNTGDIMITISQYSIRVARMPLAARSSVRAGGGRHAGWKHRCGGTATSAGRLWAAQTGIDQVTLAWDSVPGTAEYRIHLGDPSAPGTLTRPRRGASPRPPHDPHRRSARRERHNAGGG
jgi:hypothetical protein